MTLWSDLESPLKPVLDERVYVEPRDKKSTWSELQRQTLAVNFLRRHAPRLIVFAIPNSARTDREKLRQSREGAWYGASDLVCAWTGGVAFIEMKDSTGRPRANQIEFLNALAVREHHVAVCRTAEGVARFLASIGAPVPKEK